MNANFRLAFALLLAGTLTLSSQASAQTVSVPQSRPASMIQTAPFIALRLNMTVQTVAAASDIVARGRIVVSYSVVPRAGVRTLAASAARIGTYPPSLPSNTILFEVGLDGSTGFCAPLSLEQGVRQAQCFIDVNSDNKFDASYITNRAWQGKSLYWGQAARLASIPPVPYEIADPIGIVAEPLVYSFKRFRNQKAEIQIGIGPQNNGIPVQRCAIDGVTGCRLGQHIFTFEAAGSGLKVLTVVEESEQMDIVSERYN